RKGCLDLALATCIYKQEAHPKCVRRGLHLFRFGLGKNGVGRVAQVSDRLRRRHQLEQQLKALCNHFDQEEIDAGEISASSVETVNDADADRVCALHKNDWDRFGRRFGSKRTVCTLQYNYN